MNNSHIKIIAILILLLTYPQIFPMSYSSVSPADSMSFRTQMNKPRQQFQSGQYAPQPTYTNSRAARYVPDSGQYAKRFVNVDQEIVKSKLSKEEENIRNQLADYIYSAINLSNFKYKILSQEHELNLITRSKYCLSPNYDGKSSLLVFTQIGSKYFSYSINRNRLSYDKRQLVIDEMDLHPVSVRLDQSIYSGTIFDGIEYTDRVTKANTFYITDVYMFRGRKMLSEKLSHKLMAVNSYLKANLKNDELNNLVVSTTKLYPLEKIEDLIADSQTNPVIKGIAFLSEISGNKLIYFFNNMARLEKKQLIAPLSEKTNSLSVSDINPMIKPVIKSATKPPLVPYTRPQTSQQISTVSSDDEIIATFDIRKTKDSDVYKLFLVESTMRNGKPALVSKKMGIALIPTFECSVLCRDTFADKDRALMRCKYVPDKNKFQPFEVETEKTRPDDFLTIGNLIGLSDSNSEDD